MRYVDSLPEALYSADSVRAMDRYLIEEQGIDGFDLMQSAARAGFRQLRKHWPSPGSLLVLCGAGNNGGDGYLIAANAQRLGIFVECIAVAPRSKLTGDALKAFEVASAEGVPKKKTEKKSNRRNNGDKRGHREKLRKQRQRV